DLGRALRQELPDPLERRVLRLGVGAGELVRRALRARADIGDRAGGRRHRPQGSRRCRCLRLRLGSETMAPAEENADGTELARGWLSNSPFVAHLGIRIDELAPD